MVVGVCKTHPFSAFQKKETRKLKHFLFLGWPDYGVPGSADGFLKFLFHIRKAQHDFTKELGSWKVSPKICNQLYHL